MREQMFDKQRGAKLRLSEIEKLIRDHRMIVPPLSRRMLNNMCEDGTFETVGMETTKIGWLVYEDSFMKWIEGLDKGIEN